MIYNLIPDIGIRSIMDKNSISIHPRSMEGRYILPWEAMPISEQAIAGMTLL